MTQQHGRRYENQLVGDIDEVTPSEVWVTSVGYSGNAKADDCDIVVTIDPYLCTSHEQGQYNIEAKKRQGDGGNRTTVFEGSSGDESGLDEVQRLVEGTPSWSSPIIALKFDRRELVVLDARHLLSELGEMKYPVTTDPVSEDVLNVLQPRLTPSENISIIKPTLQNWESSRAADDDAVVLAERLGLPYDSEQ